MDKTFVAKFDKLITNVNVIKHNVIKSSEKISTISQQILQLQNKNNALKAEIGKVKKSK